MGVLVLLIGIFAALSSGYAFFTVFQSETVGAALGVLWMMLILNLDRLLLTTFPKTLGGRRQAAHATIRLVLATFIGITVAHPLTVRIFEPEIIEQIDAEAQKERVALTAVRDAAKAAAQGDMLVLKKALPEFGEVDQRKAERDAIVGRLNECESQMVSDKQQYLCEADGTCGTGIKHCGPVCAEKKAAYQATATRCQALRSDVGLAINVLTQAEQRLVPAANRVEGMFQDRGAAIEHDYRDALVHQAAPKKKSFFARSEAMGRLSGAARAKALFVTLALIVVEAMVVLLKIMTPADGADKLAVAIHQAFVHRIPALAETFADTGQPVRRRPRTTERVPDPASVPVHRDERSASPDVPITLVAHSRLRKPIFIVVTMLIT